MSVWRKWVPLSGALIALGVAFGWIFQLRLGGGDVYPEYSSLRADALGTKALYEALALTPGFGVDRDYHPLEKLSPRPRLILLPGLFWQNWRQVPAAQLAALNSAAGGGARVVLAFRADEKREERDEEGRPVYSDEEKKDEIKKAKTKKDDAKKENKAEEKTDKKAKDLRRLAEDKIKLKELAKEWGVTLKQRWLIAKTDQAELVPGVEAGLPAALTWHSDVYFSTPTDLGWRVLYRRAGEAVLLEKKIGRGSLVLAADAYFLSNESVNKDRATSLLTWLVGDQRHLTVVESSLGVLEDNGVGFLARRYGLGGAMALIALLGILYAWRRMVEFMPVVETSAEGDGELLAYEPAAGFTTLLRRSLGPGAVLQACVEEWRKLRRPGGVNQAAAARLDAAWQNRDPKKSLSSHYNALARSLKPR
jgi:hypothetical protein